MKHIRFFVQDCVQYLSIRHSIFNRVLVFPPFLVFLIFKSSEVNFK